MIFTGNLGYPRIGKKRELKFALERFWKGNITIEELREVAKKINETNWKLHKRLEIDFIPSGDFSLYDHVLDHAFMFGAIPDRFRNLIFSNPEELYFGMARGTKSINGEVIPAMEMTKWFNTNYHYIVPEINVDTQFSLNDKKLISEIDFARTLEIETRPKILGPISFLLLSKSTDSKIDPISRLADLFPIYELLFKNLYQKKVNWVQLDEPFLVKDLDDTTKSAYKAFFQDFGQLKERPKIMLTSYFDDVSNNIDILHHSMFEGLHIDLTYTENVGNVIKAVKNTEIISLGILDGRNIWRTDLEEKLQKIEENKSILGKRDLILAPSCSLQHLPMDIEMENDLKKEIKSWLSFSEQKLEDLSFLKRALENDPHAKNHIKKNKNVVESRKNSSLVHTIDQSIDLKALDTKTLTRKSPFPKRKKIQHERLQLPIFPTTTIGSFPQTKEVRSIRSKFSKGSINKKTYDTFIMNEIGKTIKFQEKAGIDVLVHGEFERNDMVQYFAERLDGFAFTKHGWVQSFGSRYVRPPIIYGDVTRPQPITIEWTTYAQSITKKPVKGMLTGPVTILQWSFIRDDQPHSETCKQIAFAIREEVKDLESAGTQIIQIDEPALREGLPIQKEKWGEYLEWAVNCFKIASAVANDETQIHTHMCYAEFNDIIEAIIAMDADVISIEASRSRMELLNAFGEVTYPNEIGPGLYDIHSPNIPTTDGIVELALKALEVIPAEYLWINPDCGLKTRRWEEVEPALENMTEAAKIIREKY